MPAATLSTAVPGWPTAVDATSDDSAMPEADVEVVALVMRLSASVADSCTDVDVPSTADSGVGQVARGAAGPVEALKVCPVFTLPDVLAAGADHVKAPYVDPEPVSWSEWPTEVVVFDSTTPMSVLVMPAAGPLLAVKTPSHDSSCTTPPGPTSATPSRSPFCKPSTAYSRTTVPPPAGAAGSVRAVP